jgi:hypothetical protein
VGEAVRNRADLHFGFKRTDECTHAAENSGLTIPSHALGWSSKKASSVHQKRALSDVSRMMIGSSGSSAFA